MPCRECTSRFLEAAEVARSTCPLPAAASKAIVPTQKSSFSTQAAKIRAALNATTSKLQRLAKLAQSKAYAFGDPVKDIDELSFVIKEDIKNLQMAVQDMQSQLRQRQGGNTKQEREHSETVVSSLKANLASTATTFQDVLQTRAQSMQVQQDRRGQFSSQNSAASYTRNNMLIPGLDIPLKGEEEEEEDLCGSPNDTVINVTALAHATPQNDYLESRAVAVEQIQKTMLELGQIFEQLADTVEHQKLQMQAIDGHVTTTLVHVDEAQTVWTKYLESISSDRMLAMKIFGILISFALFFIVFLK